MRKSAADANSTPRVMIVKFLDYRDKEHVMHAARTKKDVLFQNLRIMFFPDLSAEVNKQRRQFDKVKKKLRAKGLMYGFIIPVRLRVTC
ncbi:LINE-1 type transposase domain-containing protein 1 [Labeo rohita]|uniref:LINE-1 type transposase domain-containing protein 1 n=1 Tax=Labeo rohita TaxID=84645 RepID=A0ABQ8M075_LABRO|nr:LINE-1 type transposase domain-containing protein 1 [Labeo rohita]